MDEKTWSLRRLVPGIMQIPVCFALMKMGFHFGDLKSLVMFLYAFPYIMLGLEAFFHKDFDDIAKDRYWPIAIFGAVIQLTLQLVGFYYVVDCVFKQYDNKSSDSLDEETPTFISAIVILIIELVLIGNIVWKIYKMQRCARMSKYWSEKILKVLHSDKMKSTTKVWIL